jgi:hypothetical protein
MRIWHTISLVRSIAAKHDIAPRSISFKKTLAGFQSLIAVQAQRDSSLASASTSCCSTPSPFIGSLTDEIDSEARLKKKASQTLRLFRKPRYEI